MEKTILPHNHGHLSKDLRNNIPKAQTFETISNIFKVLSDNKRIEIFWILCHCEECVINISTLVEMSSPAVSHHLKILQTSGFVVSRREGKEVYYTAAKTARTDALHEMIEQIIEVACPSEEPFAKQQLYDSNVQTVNEVHEFLIRHIQDRYTIEELADRFHINQTTLKASFKTVFGQPIAAYMKEYRIKQAKDLLAHSNRSIAEIACDVGYENQSKFTQAFKNVTGMLPKEYRKTHL